MSDNHSHGPHNDDEASALAKIERAEARYRALFDTIPIGLYRSTSEGAILDVNPRLVHLLGHSDKNSLIAKNATDLYVDSQARQKWKALMKHEGVVRGFETQVRRHDGQLIWVRDSARAVRDASGRITHYEGSLEDITEHKLAEDKVRKSETRFRTLFQEAPIGLLSIDTNGAIQGVNRTALELLGSPSEKATKQINILTFQPLKDAGISAHFEECVKEGKIFGDEQPYTSKWGKSAVLQYKLAPIFDTEDNIVEILCGFVDVSESKRTEQELRDSEERLRQVINLVPHQMFVRDRKGCLVLLNKVFAESYGKTVEDILGKEFSSIHADTSEVERFLQEDAKIIRTKRQMHFPESQFTMPDGSIRWHDTRKIPIRFGDSGTCVLGVALDITENKQAAEEIRKSEEKFRMLFQETPIGILTCDIEGNILSVNRTGLELLGSPSEEATKQINLLTFKALRDAGISGDIKRCIMQSETVESERPYVSKWGKATFLRIKIIPTLNQDGTVNGTLSVFEDISERKLVQDALSQSEETHRTIIQSMNDLIFVFDKNDRFTNIHASKRELMVAAPEEFLGKTIAEAMPSPIAGQFSTLCRIVRETSETKRIDYPLEIDDKEHWFSADFNPHEDGERIVVVVRDITELKVAEKRIRAERNGAMFYLDLMAHDFRNQLQVILANSALLGATNDLITQRSMLAQIEQSCEKCSEMIDKIKLTEQLMTVSLKGKSLDEALRKCIENLGVRFRNISIERSFDVEDAVVLADEFLERLLSNLMMNAVEHNPNSEKHIWISLQKQERGYVVAIADNGPGISDTMKTSLFDMSRRFGGIGLHQAKQIIEKYGGQIEVHDRVPGAFSKGAEFRLFFPKFRSDSTMTS
ncbi:MAG: PAS domain S-box protein [Candidatus Thorarchaeota archaeon]|nr:PAS domain S-box protein [Candidatus Thorarchaeota archaeon]